MADANSIRIVYIFEACARLRCRSEISALAAHIYHRFFRIKPDMSQFELYSFGSACIMLAHRFYEQDLKADELAIVAASIAHGPNYYLSSKMITKLAHSIDFISLVIAVNTNFEISFKEELSMTPGDFLKSLRAQTQEVVELDTSMSVDSEDMEEDEADYLLANNSKHIISSHRLSNLAWTFLNDFHWHPRVVCHLPDHIACACLMMAIESFTKAPDRCADPEQEGFWKLLSKKWNLILCDDLANEKLNRIVYTIIKNYGEYELIFRKEFTKDVIDP